MLKRLTLAVFFLSVFVLQGCFEDKNTILKSDKFTLNSLKNKVFTVTKTKDGFKVNELENKIIIFDIFATWCPPCRAEVSHLSSLQKKFKNDLVVIGVTVENGVENAKLQKFKQQYNINYILVNSSQNRRFISELATNLNVGRNFGIPLMAMYKDGKLIRFYQGATEEEFMQSDIEQALGK